MAIEGSEGAMSRRSFTGMGLAAGAAAFAGLPAVPAVAGAPSLTPLAVPRPEALNPINPALTYVQIDALAFFTYETGQERYFVDSTGVQSVNSGHYLAAPIPIPVGSTIYQVNIAYRSQPICEIRLRDHVTVTPFTTPFQQTPPNSASATQISYDLSPGITIADHTSALFAFYSSGGSALYGVTLGYTPPTQSFVSFSGGAPRILDTRPVNGGAGPLQPGEERVIALGHPGARGAVFNLTVTDTSAGGGYVAVFPANIAWPGNSSINWESAGQNIANGVITAVDSNCQIKIRGGANPTNVIIDRIGWLI